MTEEVPKNYVFLKFIVIFMGVLIVLGLAVVAWKIMDLAKQKAARAKNEVQAKEQLLAPEQLGQLPNAPFAFDLLLESGEVVLETSSAPGGLWIRIGKNGITHRMILVDYSGNIIGNIKVKQEDEKAVSAN